MVSEQQPVVIVGAGLAGLAAAVVLARRGVPVRVLEKSARVGGKLWSERLADPTRSLEHGVHGWWNTYQAFDWLLGEVGVVAEDVFSQALTAGVVVGAETVDPFNHPVHRWPSPLHFLANGTTSTQIGLREAWRAIPLLFHLLAFDFAEDFDDYDAISLAELARQLRVPFAVMQFAIEPFAAMFSYAAPEGTSASSALALFEAHLLAEGAHILPRWPKGPVSDVILDPMVRTLRTTGCALVESRQEVVGLDIEDSVVVGVNVGRHVERTVDLGLVPLGSLALVVGEPTVLIGRFDGRIRAFEAVCPHMGAPLEVVGGQVSCTLHSGCFDDSGAPTGGPPLVPLAPLNTEVVGQQVVVTRKQEHIAATEVIVATDVMAARYLLDREPMDPAFRRRLQQLPRAPLVVVRLWFVPGPAGALDQYDTLLHPLGELVDGIFVINRIDPTTEADALVVEIHARDPDGTWSNLPDHSLLQQALADLSMVVPTLTRARLDKSRPPVVQRITRSFTGHAPGSGVHRPEATTPVRGLYVAGDWTRPEPNAWFMEHAVRSGVRAANEVLRRRGLARVWLPPMPRDGIVRKVSRTLGRLGRQLFPIKSRPVSRGGSS